MFIFLFTWLSVMVFFDGNVFGSMVFALFIMFFADNSKPKVTK